MSRQMAHRASRVSRWIDLGGRAMTGLISLLLAYVAVRTLVGAFRHDSVGLFLFGLIFTVLAGAALHLAGRPRTWT